jgi:DNA-binding GntR family transcriptional regulator
MPSSGRIRVAAVPYVGRSETEKSALKSRVTVVSIVDAVAASLREKLFDGVLIGNSTLTEADVAAMYDVARPTAKSAIQQLVSEGLFLRDAHKTARVPSMGPDDVRDLLFSRTCIESGVVRELARRCAVPAAAQESNRIVYSFVGHSDFDAIAPVVDFHLGLVRSLGSERVQRIFTGLMSEMRLCMVQMHHRRQLDMNLIAEEHDAILASIAGGDPDAAAQAMSDHLAKALDRILRTVEAPPDSMSGQDPAKADQ